MITVELNSWPSQVVGHSPKNVLRVESVATRQAQSNTQTAGGATLVDWYNIPYEHLQYGYAASEQKPVGSDITYCTGTRS